MLRVVVAIAAVLAALLMGGVGAGLAMADPEDPGNVVEPTDGADPPATSEPTPTVAPPPVSVFDLPNTIATQLRDMFGRPLSVFGNGRVPGTHTLPDGTTPKGSDQNRKRERPADEPDPGALLPDPPVAPEPPARQIPASTVDVTLPFSPTVSVPVPSVPVPGYEELHWRLNLTDPYSAYSSMQETVQTVNSIIRDAYAPFNPFPPKKPEPTFRILQEEPVVEADGGNASPMSESTPDLPVLRAPMLVVPPARVEVPRPAAEAVPAAPPGQVLGAGSAGVRTPDVRGSVTQTGSLPQGQGQGAGRGAPNATANPPADALGAPSLRQGYPQYLRAARPAQLAAVALPGLAGLIAITAGGGVIGYRQANSGRHLRSEAGRFLP